jgi:hypothetical protein
MTGVELELMSIISIIFLLLLLLIVLIEFDLLNKLLLEFFSTLVDCCRFNSKGFVSSDKLIRRV